MRRLIDMDTIQIEITNACHSACSNCTRFCGHTKPFFMTLDYFKMALDTMVEYPQMTGIMGGDPLLHPQFKEICEYAASKIPPDRLGLWTSFPAGYEHYREIICRTFGNIFLNDHTKSDIYHAPILVAAEEIMPTEPERMWLLVDHCWLQQAWSAAINPKGAFFCEIAASLSVLYEGLEEFKDHLGWPVKSKWWYRTPKDYKEQIEKYCRVCGCALTLSRRVSTDGRDDVSLMNLERLKRIGSRKVRDGKYVISDLKLKEDKDLEPMAAYKDQHFRDVIAARYGIFLVLNQKQFLSPFLMSDAESEKAKIRAARPSLFQQIVEKYGGK